jgi:tetratricopeptide (TPR) repeat protein
MYVNLHGATPGLAPLESLEALVRMLRSLGVEPALIPTDLDEAAAQFRSLCAERRLLVLLDNARSATQVRPLLPGSLTCAALVTSRMPLATLEGSHALQLDVLPHRQALDLLARIAGRARVATDRAATEEVVRYCGHLPIAIRIAGARLAANDRSVRELATELANAAQRLGALEVDELVVRSTFDVSLRALRDSNDPVDSTAADAFSMLGMLSGADVAVPAAARLLDRTEAATRLLLDRLVDVQLLETRQSDRYQLHDLIRLFAQEQAGRQFTAREQVAAMTRVTAFYAGTVWGTLRLLRPGDRRLGGADPRWLGDSLEFEDESMALRWLEAERPNLLSAISKAAKTVPNGEPAIPPELVGQLARASFGFFAIRGYLDDWIHACEAALQVAQRTADRRAEASAYNDLGVAYARLGRFQAAIHCLQAGIPICQEVGDLDGEAAALSALGISYVRLGRAEEGRTCLEQSLAISRRLDDRQGQARSLLNVTLAYNRLGMQAEASASLQQSLVVFRDLGDKQGQAVSLNNLGHVHRESGRLEAARECLRESLAICAEVGDRLGQANSLNELGAVYRELHEHTKAIDCQQQSLAIYRELGVHRDQVVALRDLGDVLHEVGRYEEMLTAWHEALRISEGLGIPEASELHARLAAAVRPDTDEIPR